MLRYIILLCALLFPLCCSGQQLFNDVPTTSPYFNPTKAMYSLGITKGCNNPDPPEYCPDSSLLRDQIAVFIIRAWSRRLWNDPEAFLTYAPPSGTPWFSDVGTSHPNFVYIQKMWELGITSGCTVTPRDYCPNGTIENYQIAVFIARARVVADGGCLTPCANDNFYYPSTPYFNDVSDNQQSPYYTFYFKWIQRMAYLGAVSPYEATPGCSVGYFCPYGVFTRRGEMAKEVMTGIVTWSYWNTRILVEMHLSPPTQWKGISYSPRRHTFFRMLYDWNDQDATTGQYVHQMVDADLTMLKQSGFNLLHLYLWDIPLLKGENGQEEAGFCPYPDAPNSCNGFRSSQWGALNDFVQRAENKGLYVALHFASGQFVSDFNKSVNNATQFAQWANHFIDYLRPRKNVLAWGLAWSVTPPADMSTKAMTWRDAYRLLDTYSRAASPNPRIMGLIGTFLGLPGPGNSVIARGSQYLWDWQAAQRSVKGMRNLLTGAFGYTKDPDLYMMHLYPPNSFDLSAALSALVNAPYDPYVALNPDRNRIFINEFATSSSVKEPWVSFQETVKGNDIQTFGDDNTPVLTPSGQAQWVGCALAAFSGVGIQKLAHWSLYDPYTMWSGEPWNQTGHKLAWNGYWGLKYEREADGNKPAWGTLVNFYQSGSAACPTVPINTLKTDNAYYTTGQPAGLTWTAANTAVWELSPLPYLPYAPSYDCKSGEWFSPVASGSCAFTFSTGATSTGTQTYTFTAKPSGGWPATTALATATIVGAPLVYVITDEYDSTVLNQYGWIVVTGNAFSKLGGFNTLQFLRSGYNDVWMYAGDGSGYPFQQGSYTQISAMLGGRLAPGQWQLYVRNGYASGPAGPITVTVN